MDPLLAVGVVPPLAAAAAAAAAAADAADAADAIAIPKFVMRSISIRWARLCSSERSMRARSLSSAAVSNRAILARMSLVS